jgi:hypothetical protein
VPHKRDREANRKFTSACTEATACFADDDSELLRSRQIDVVRMVTRLRNDPEIRQPFEQVSRKTRPLPIGNKRIEAFQSLRWPERCPEYADLRTLPQPAHTFRMLIGIVYVV